MSAGPDYVAQAVPPLRKLVPYDPGHDLPLCDAGIKIRVQAFDHA